MSPLIMNVVGSRIVNNRIIADKMIWATSFMCMTNIQG